MKSHLDMFDTINIMRLSNCSFNTWSEGVSKSFMGSPTIDGFLYMPNKDKKKYSYKWFSYQKDFSGSLDLRWSLVEKCKNVPPFFTYRVFSWIGFCIFTKVIKLKNILCNLCKNISSKKLCISYSFNSPWNLFPV